MLLKKFHCQKYLVDKSHHLQGHLQVHPTFLFCLPASSSALSGGATVVQLLEIMNEENFL